MNARKGGRPSFTKKLGHESFTAFRGPFRAESLVFRPGQNYLAAVWILSAERDLSFGTLRYPPMRSLWTQLTTSS